MRLFKFLFVLPPTYPLLFHPPCLFYFFPTLFNPNLFIFFQITNFFLTYLFILNLNVDKNLRLAQVYVAQNDGGPLTFSPTIESLWWLFRFQNSFRVWPHITFVICLKKWYSHLKKKIQANLIFDNDWVHHWVLHKYGLVHILAFPSKYVSTRIFFFTRYSINMALCQCCLYPTMGERGLPKSEMSWIP